MQLTLLGATGPVGRALLLRALEQNHDLKVLCRLPEKLGELQSRVQVVHGNYFDPDALGEAISGSHAVLSTIGPQQKPAAGITPERYVAALENLFAAMRAQGIDRFINILGAGALVENERPQLQRRIMRTVMGVIAGHILATKQAEYEAISSSGLNWTALRPGMITSTGGRFVPDTLRLANYKVDRDQLADFMLENLNSGEWIGKAPLVATV